MTINNNNDIIVKVNLILKVVNTETETVIKISEDGEYLPIPQKRGLDKIRKSLYKMGEDGKLLLCISDIPPSQLISSSIRRINSVSIKSLPLKIISEFVSIMKQRIQYIAQERKSLITQKKNLLIN